MVIFFFVLLLISYFELSTETKELIITLSESVKNKAELSRMLNIPRTTITSVLSKYRRTGTVETMTRSDRKTEELHKQRQKCCLEDYLRSRILGTFVVKFLACLPIFNGFLPLKGHLGFSGAFFLAETFEKESFDPYNFRVTRLSARKSEQMKNF